jgi:hypothetical protein
LLGQVNKNKVGEKRVNNFDAEIRYVAGKLTVSISLDPIESDSLRCYKGISQNSCLHLVTHKLIPVKLRTPLYSIVVIRIGSNLLLYLIMRLRKGKRGRPGRRWENSIKMNLRETCFKRGSR